MSTWNYRIVKYADGSGYGMHEVYYNKRGRATHMTAEPVGLYGVTLAEMFAVIRRASGSALMRPVFHEPKKWSK